MADRQTSPVAPPSIALAMMALRKAGFFEEHPMPALRSAAECGLCFPMSLRYYEIIDAISAGEQP